MRIKPLAYALGIITIVSAFVAAGCGSQDSATTAAGTATTGGAKSASAAPGLKELKIEDVKKGTGDAAAQGDQIWVLYTGKLANGTVFDSTSTRDNKPFEVTIGTGQVIAGWEKGLIGLKVGGERNLSIPYAMAYGEAGKGPVPARADLFFNLKAVAIVKKGEERTVQVEIINKGSGPVAKVGDKVTFSYVATLPTGEVFEKSPKKGLTVRLGKDELQFIGLDKGIQGMKVGDERKLTIPPMLGLYMGNDKIPTNSVTIFDVKLLKIG